ncbi:hypothetical protein [Herbaspirillum rubrisubalbicans]|uniref:Uncharacterized protein n=1 Tax=Herbaspirillum rubrisubalbicans TaxID=80842 RepID=A0AAD0UDH7_9BURK|nr:hypothetical protein [Herbaspirillum rubrisubalbicans]AYR26821.1 hypothetical protein RC54_24665 [Herbaspirillum rubrisubalbicans]
MNTAAIETIVVEATTDEKKLIASKARKLGLQVSELMRLGAVTYEAGQMEEELEALAALAQEAAERAAASIDETLAFVAASNARIAALEADAPPARRP